MATLNIFQRLIRTWDEVHPYNAAQILNLRGRADPAAVNNAWRDEITAAGLESVRHQDRHACHAPLPGNNARFCVRELSADIRLDEHLSAALNCSFDDPDEPPLRAFRMQLDASFYFGVVYQHWVADSVSIRMLLRAFMARLGGNEASAEEKPRLARAGYGDLFGQRRQDVRPLQTALGLFRAHMRFRRARKVSAAGIEQPTVGVRLRALEAEIPQRLRTAARQMGATVGDVLQAALAEAAYRHLPFQKRSNRPDLAIGNIVDLRPYADRGLEREFGLFLGFTQIFCRPETMRDFNRLLRCISAQNRAHRNNGLAQSSAGWMLGALAVRRFVPPANLYRFYRKEMPLAAGLSNVNLTGSWAESLHPDPLIEYLRVSPTGPMVPVALSATTLCSHMRLALTYRVSLLCDAQARDMMESVARRLVEVACCGGAKTQC